jgi:hypothetical protein
MSASAGSSAAPLAVSSLAKDPKSTQLINSWSFWLLCTVLFPALQRITSLRLFHGSSFFRSLEPRLLYVNKQPFRQHDRYPACDHKDCSSFPSNRSVSKERALRNLMGCTYGWLKKLMHYMPSYNIPPCLYSCFPHCHGQSPYALLLVLPNTS